MNAVVAVTIYNSIHSVGTRFDSGPEHQLSLGFRNFLQPFQASFETLKFFQIHYSSTSLPSGAIKSEKRKASLNKH
jgi:hypothetical protein